MSTEMQQPVEGITSSDLERLAEFAQLMTAARDALSDDIISRLAGAMSEGLNLLDRLTRNEGLMRLLQVLDRQESQQVLLAMSDAIHMTSRDIVGNAPAVGGLACLFRIARDPRTQEGLRLLSVFGNHLSHGLREQHRLGG
jgi:hypothetical protein